MPKPGFIPDLMNFHGRGTQRIVIHPQSFDVPQRVEASAKAAEMGCGLLMELHSSHTEYYADPDVPVGKVDVWAPKTYKGQPEYVTTLDSPEQDWAPEGQREFWEKLNQLAQNQQRLSPLQEALWTPLNDYFDLDVESFKLMWPELSALLAKHSMTQRQILQDRVWLHHEDGTPKTNDEIR